MNKKVWLQLILLLVILAGVVGLIYQLRRSSNLGSSMALLFYGVETQHQVRWCETRVTSIELPGKFKVFQKGLKWYRQEEPSAATYELGFVPVEKWFASYCSLPVEGKTEGLTEELSGPQENVLARVSFINGDTAAFKKVAEGLFTWQNITFRSHQLEEALKNLAALPERGGPDASKTDH